MFFFFSQVKRAIQKDNVYHLIKSFANLINTYITIPPNIETRLSQLRPYMHKSSRSCSISKVSHVITRSAHAVEDYTGVSRVLVFNFFLGIL